MTDAPNPSAAKTAFTVDDLAQEIRRVDGSHSLGAGALAEALWPFLSLYTHPQPSLSVGLDREAVARVIAPKAWALLDHEVAERMKARMGMAIADVSEIVGPSLKTADAILALAAPAEGWQPIETAPKDGTRVLIGFYRNNVFVGPGDGPQSWCIIGSYREDDPPPLTASAWQTETGQGFQWTPTHWMPLPAAPTGETGA